ncbi:MAG: endolytic transglycosylase MltG, partial [Candidatus Faecivicinus sp.]|nr:endolytic transglycosylase MltG [Candidatus Faecivicinus sp.]
LFWYAWLWKLLRPVMIFLCSALIVIGIVTKGYNMVYDRFLAPANSLDASLVDFEVKSGDTVSGIGQSLEQDGLLRNQKVFKYLVQFKGLTNSLSYGTYKLSPSMTVDEIITELTSGNQTNERVITIIPGWTAEDVADYLVGIGAIADRNEFLTLMNDVDHFIGSSYALRAAHDADGLANRKYALEGYLAPDTYRIFLSATPESIINTLLAQDNTVVDEIFYSDNREYYTDADGTVREVEKYQTMLSMDQSIILASIIEKEASTAEDMARVSAVFHNRLRLGMKLESDPTATYLTGEKKLALSESEISAQNAYNTYYVSGLPAGPICNPSKTALNAALNPDMTYIQEGYLYFCATEPGSGTLAFAKTKEEHDENVAKYRPLWEAYDRQQANNP